MLILSKYVIKSYTSIVMLPTKVAFPCNYFNVSFYYINAMHECLHIYSWEFLFLLLLLSTSSFQMCFLGTLYSFMPPAFFIFTASTLHEIILVATGNSQKQGRVSGSITKPEKVSRSEEPASRSENYKKETELKKIIQNKKETNMLLSEDYKHRRGKNHSSSIAPLDKVLVHLMLVSTC